MSGLVRTGHRQREPLLDGMAGLVDLGSVRRSGRWFESATDADMYALRMDWETVRHDWRIVREDALIATEKFIAEMARIESVPAKTQQDSDS